MDESPWQYWSMILAPAADQAGINAAVAAQLDPVGGQFTLRAGLAPSGSPVGSNATHYWCKSKLTINGANGVLSLAPAFPNARGYIWADDGNDAELLAMFASMPNVGVGEISPAQVLAEHGLQEALQ